MEFEQEIELNGIRMLDGGWERQRGFEVEEPLAFEFIIIVDLMAASVPSSQCYQAASEASQSWRSSASAAAAPGSAASSEAQIDPDNTS